MRKGAEAALPPVLPARGLSLAAPLTPYIRDTASIGGGVREVGTGMEGDRN